MNKARGADEVISEKVSYTVDTSLTVIQYHHKTLRLFCVPESILINVIYIYVHVLAYLYPRSEL